MRCAICRQRQPAVGALGPARIAVTSHLAAPSRVPSQAVQQGPPALHALWIMATRRACQLAGVARIPWRDAPVERGDGCLSLS